MISISFKSAIPKIKKGELVIIPTDTLYGLVCSALNKSAVSEIYKIKNRNTKSPLIILISKPEDLSLFNIPLTPPVLRWLKKLWPGKNSLILPCSAKKFNYLSRGGNSIAFRLPAKRTLLNFIKKTGPLVAPSANPQGLPPARNLKEARQYFANQVKYFVPGRLKSSKPSSLYKISPQGNLARFR